MTARGGAHVVRIETRRVRFVDVAEGETILDAALAQGVDFPSFCRAGTCRTCACDLLTGEVELLPYAEFALTAEERANGRILACRALPQTDCSIAFPDGRDRAQHPLRLLPVTVTSIEFPTPGVARLRCGIGARGPFFFTPGQYVSVAFPGVPPTDLSIASIPRDAELEFHVRIEPDDPTARYVAERVRPGEIALVRGPFGSAHFRASHSGPLLLGAIGTGLAPVLSILREALRADRRRAAALYVAARDRSDLYARPALDALAAHHSNLRVRYALAEPLAVALARDVPPLRRAKAYLAGPAAEVEAAVAVLRELGLPRRDIHAQPFQAR